MLFKNIKYIDENFEVQDNAFVGVLDDKIDYIGKSEPKDAAKYGEVYDGSNKLLMSGFYNVHAHAAAVILRSYADKQPLNEWLNDWIFPFEAKMTGEDYYWSTLLGLAEMARFGIVSCSDMYFEGQDRIRAIVESKMKVNTCEAIVSFDDIHFEEHPLYKVSMDVIDKYNGAENGKIITDLCVHGEYTTKETICREIGQMAKEKNLIIHSHVSETQAEHEECKKRHNGLTPIQYFESIGMLDAKNLIAHGDWLEIDDLKIMKEHGVSIATCPASNLKLGSGIADLPIFLKEGINIGLGTDGMGSNNNHNFLQDMYIMALLNRGHAHDSSLMPADIVFKIATVNGAKAQGRKNCGLLKQGYKADLTVMDLSEIVWCPGENILNNLIYAGIGSDICLTMVDGEVVYKDGNWPHLDIEKIKSEVASRRKRIVGEL